MHEMPRPLQNLKPRTFDEPLQSLTVFKRSRCIGGAPYEERGYADLCRGGSQILLDDIDERVLESAGRKVIAPYFLIQPLSHAVAPYAEGPENRESLPRFCDNAQYLIIECLSFRNAGGGDKHDALGPQNPDRDPLYRNTPAERVADYLARTKLELIATRIS